MNVLHCNCFNTDKYPFNIVYEGVDWIAVTDLKHSEDTRHYLIISKLCTPFYLDVPYYSSVELFQIAKKLSINMPNHYLHVNNGSFQEVRHVHWHIRE